MEEQGDIKNQIESLLFVAAKPVSVKKIAELLEVSRQDAQKACQELLQELEENDRGVRLIVQGQKYQMVSSPKNSHVVQKILEDETSGELTQPALETLTIIAYRAPVSKIEIERIRGVNCSLILRNLLMRGLVEYKKDKTKGETYYTVSFEFLRFLGMGSIEELPDYEKLSQHESIEEMMREGD